MKEEDQRPLQIHHQQRNKISITKFFTHTAKCGLFKRKRVGFTSSIRNELGSGEVMRVGNNCVISRDGCGSRFHMGLGRNKLGVSDLKTW
ncbi:hypothetical protein V6N11_001499 [Hibiscus sabdariffa]|uniref:Uncharacterized protein n=2 Tax=Hibiscus sabdariffa TaxID=183260 RepID=A0ABR1ZR21_9ROSI